MAKKNQDAEKVNEVPVEKSEPVKKIKILSLRKGDIQLKGLTIKHQDVIEVEKSVADYLLKSFKGEMRLI